MAIGWAVPPRRYGIGELAARTGLSVHTIRWYESQGLFPTDVARSASGRRVYGDDAVRWLSVLARLRESGMPVAELSKLSDLVRAGDGNEPERIALMESHAQLLDEQIARMVEARELVRAKIGDYRRVLAERDPGIAPDA